MAEGSTKLPIEKGHATRAPVSARHPISLREELNRLFDEFSLDLGPWPAPRSFLGRDVIERARANAPAVDIAETDAAFELTAELPGMSEADVAVELVNGDLRIRGEKKEEREEKNKDIYLSERSYGAFERRFRVPEGVNKDKIDAAFSNGVLKITLPKAAAAAAQKIDVKKA